MTALEADVLRYVQQGFTILEAVRRSGLPNGYSFYRQVSPIALREILWAKAIISGGFTIHGEYFPTVLLPLGDGQTRNRTAIDCTKISRPYHFDIFQTDLVDSFLDR